MTHRQRHTLIAWLLPLLCLRALVPVGFMPVVTDTGWQIALCNGSTYQVSNRSVAANKSAASDSEHANQHKQSSDGPCLFALSAASAPIPLVAATDFAQSFDRSFLRLTREWLLARPLIRAQQSRAPPFYS